MLVVLFLFLPVVFLVYFIFIDYTRMELESKLIEENPFCKMSQLVDVNDAMQYFWGEITKEMNRIFDRK